MPSFMSPTFIIGSIRIGSVESASCINMGNNWPTDFQSNQKTVQGFGSVAGDHNQLVGTRSILSDPDFIDMLNVGDSEAPEWLQQMIANQAQDVGIEAFEQAAGAVKAAQTEHTEATEVASKEAFKHDQ